MATDRDILDNRRRNMAFEAAIECCPCADPRDITDAATIFLDWLRNPKPAVAINLRVGEPVSK